MAVISNPVHRVFSRFENLRLRCRIRCLEREGRRVDAETLAGRWRAVLKDVPEVGIAARAADFSTDHAVTGVAQAPDGAGFGFFPKARPAAAGCQTCWTRQTAESRSRRNDSVRVRCAGKRGH